MAEVRSLSLAEVEPSFEYFLEDDAYGASQTKLSAQPCRHVQMSGTKAANVAGVKRKRDTVKPERHQLKSKTRRTSPSSEADDPQATISRLGDQVFESRKNLNNIATLIKLAEQHDTTHETAILAAVTLCKVFSKLLAGGDMVKSKGMPESEVVIVQWLKERYRAYIDMLLDQYLRNGEASTQSVGLTLVMRLVRNESESQGEYNWKHGPLPRIVETILFLPTQDTTREEFAEKYFKIFDDIRFYTFQTIS